MKNLKIDTTKIENFPDGCVVVYDHNIPYVVKRKFERISVNKYKENRTRVGRIHGDKFYTLNEYNAIFKKKGKTRTKKVEKNDDNIDYSALNYSSKYISAIFLFFCAAVSTGIYDDLIKTFGKIQANIIISTSFYLLLQGSTALNGYKNFSENYALPFPDSISSTEFSEFNESLGSACILSNNLQTLFKLRLDKAEENSNGSLDGTSIGTTSNTSYTEVGKGKNGEFQSQIGLNILMDNPSLQPMMFTISPGNQHDINELPKFLKMISELSSTYRIKIIVADRGYFSEDIIKYAISNDYKIIVAGKTNVNWIREEIDKTYEEIKKFKNFIAESRSYGKTVEVIRNSQDSNNEYKTYLHIYYSPERHEREKTNFLKSLDSVKDHIIKNDKKIKDNPAYKFFVVTDENGVKKVEFNETEIEKHCKYFGFYTSVSTFEIDAKNAQSLYWTRDISEKAFKNAKTDLGFDVIRAHNDFSLMARAIYLFVSLTIMGDIRRRMRDHLCVHHKNGKVKVANSVCEDMTWKQLLSKFKNLKINYENGVLNFSKFSNKQLEILKKLGYENFANSIPLFARDCFDFTGTVILNNSPSFSEGKISSSLNSGNSTSLKADESVFAAAEKPINFTSSEPGDTELTQSYVCENTGDSPLTDTNAMKPTQENACCTVPGIEKELFSSDSRLFHNQLSAQDVTSNSTCKGNATSYTLPPTDSSSESSSSQENGCCSISISTKNDSSIDSPLSMNTASPNDEAGVAQREAENTSDSPHFYASSASSYPIT